MPSVPSVARRLGLALCLGSLVACGLGDPTHDSTGTSTHAITGATPIVEVQGAGHVSPLAGRRVSVRGVVTGGVAETRRRPAGFWIETPADASVDVPTVPADGASTGLFVIDARSDSSQLEPGDEVVVDGRVVELGDDRDLTVTALEATRVVEVGSGRPLPAPVVLGPTDLEPFDRAIPALVDDDGLSVYRPLEDAIDLFESLEGRRVEIRDARVVGPTSNSGRLVVVPGGSATGEIPLDDEIAAPGRDFDPRAIRLSARRLARMPSFDVGATFRAPIVGIVDYESGAYRVLPLEMPSATPPTTARDATTLSRGPEHLLVASFNVLNLAATDEQDKFLALARVVVDDLATPDLVGLQEVQDDSGSEDDGVVAAERTLARLVDAIEAASGPRYASLQRDPVDKADGGRPGGNIRVAFLYDPERLEAVDASRLLDPSFDADPSRDWRATRKPLVGHFRVRFVEPRLDLHAINLHLRSKGSDDRPMGPRQPPRRVSEAQRVEQAKAVRRAVETLVRETSSDTAVLVLGDFNEHPARPPLEVLRDTPLVDLSERLDPSDRFSYNFEGGRQQLDYILLSPWLARTASPEIDIAHVSSLYAAERRASDHDPVLVRLDLSEL